MVPQIYVCGFLYKTLPLIQYAFRHFTNCRRLQGSISDRMAIKRKVLIRCAKDGMSDRPKETSFYVCPTEISAEKAAEAIRSHRGVENSNHYVRDIAMQEDACRIRTNPRIFARARRLALNILPANHENNIADARWCDALDIRRALQYGFK